MVLATGPCTLLKSSTDNETTQKIQYYLRLISTFGGIAALSLWVFIRFVFLFFWNAYFGINIERFFYFGSYSLALFLQWRAQFKHTANHSETSFKTGWCGRNIDRLRVYHIKTNLYVRDFISMCELQEQSRTKRCCSDDL